MDYHPQECGADCARCPLGPNGYLTTKHRLQYRPVPGQYQRISTPLQDRIAAVAECPADDEVRLGYPLAGKSGAKWNELLLISGHRREHVDLYNVISCRPPGQASGAYQRMVKEISEENKRRLPIGMPLLIYPADACRPRLIGDLRGYRRLIALGGTASKSLTGKDKNITAIRGEMITINSVGKSTLPSNDDDGVKIVPTFHPSFVNRTPVHQQTVLADLGRAFRWFDGKLTWRTPSYLRQPGSDQLEVWLRYEYDRTKRIFGRPRFIVDTETDNGGGLLEPSVVRLRCFAIATVAEDDGGAHVAGCNILSFDGVTRFYSDVEEANIRRLVVKYILDDPDVDMYGHNIVGFDKGVLERYFYYGDNPVAHQG